MILNFINYFYWLFLRVFKKKKIFSKSVSIKANIDDDVLIRKGVKVSNNCSIGRRTYISGPDTIIHSGNIGRYCSIALGVKVGLDEHDYSYLSTHPFLYSNYFGNFVKEKHSIQHKHSPVINDDVWIGANSIICRGVTIGKGAVIGAGSVVTKNVKPYSIVAGVPAKHIKYRFHSTVIEELLSLDWCSWSDAEISENLDKFYEENNFKHLIL